MTGFMWGMSLMAILNIALDWTNRKLRDARRDFVDAKRRHTLDSDLPAMYRAAWLNGANEVQRVYDPEAQP